MFRREESRRLTEDSPGRDGLSVEPERHLGEDDRHDAGQVRLDHKVADFPLQVEVGCHHNILSCGRQTQDTKVMLLKYILRTLNVPVPIV